MGAAHLEALVASALAALGPAVMACDHADFLHDLAVHESGLNPSAVNSYGYVGLFQMGEGALQDAGYYRGDLTRSNDWTGAWTGLGGVTNLADFYAHPDVQVQAIVAYHNRLLAQIHAYGLDNAVGHSIGGVGVTLSGLVAGAHLVGIGNLQRFVNSGGSTIPRDGNGVPITSYIAELGNCTLDGPAPSFATVAAATGGAGIGTAPVLPPGAAVSASPSPLAVDPDSAFAMASGRSPAEVRDSIAAIIATLLMLWVVWTASSHIAAWRKRRLSLQSLQTDIVRACVVLSIVIVILQ